MKEYLFCEGYADLENLMTGRLKPEYYIRKIILIFLIYYQVLNVLKTTHMVSTDS